MINAMHMASKQNQAKNKKMKMKANRFHPGILAAAAFALATGCAGNDSTDEDSMQGNTTAAVRLTDFASAANPDASSKRIPMSRTSMQNHHYLTGGEFMWEPGDKIYVKDDDNTMQNSGSNSNITATQPTARFQLPGKYDGSTYEVYYTGTATTANASTVTIASSQTQAAPNDTKHFGASGDCGTATATRVGDHFEFMLDHKASYLCFLPRVMNAALAPNVYLTKIVVKSDNAIAGDYTLSLAGLGSAPTANAASEITLTTQGAAQACPNVNEMLWYAMQGDPHSDRETLWSTMGHLYKAGMWFKKKAKITGFNAASYNGTDYRTVPITTSSPIYNNSVVSGKPSDITNYFYVPFLGRYVNGTINAIGSVGHYWTSNSNIWSNGQALDLHMDNNQTGIISYTRSNGVTLFYSE